MKKDKDVLIALIISGVLITTSFMPVLQISIMQANSVLLYPFDKVLGINDLSSTIVIETICSFITLFFFYKATEIKWKITSAILSVVFLLPLMVFLSESKIPQTPFFLPPLLTGLTVGLLLLGVAFLKRHLIQGKGLPN